MAKESTPPAAGSKRTRADDEEESPGSAEKKQRISPRTAAAAEALGNLALETSEKKTESKTTLWSKQLFGTPNKLVQPGPQAPDTPRVTPPREYSDLGRLHYGDIQEGNVILARTFDKYVSRNRFGDDEYEATYVNYLDDKRRTPINNKYRKFVIVMVSKPSHFVGLPIYSHKLSDPSHRDLRAEIIDSRSYNKMCDPRLCGHFLHKRFLNGPSCRGGTTNEQNIIWGREGGRGTWLTFYPNSYGEGGSGMRDASTVELGQPARFSIMDDAKLLGKLKDVAQIELVKKWHLEVMAHEMNMDVGTWTTKSKSNLSQSELNRHVAAGGGPKGAGDTKQTDDEESATVLELRKTLKERDDQIAALKKKSERDAEIIKDLKAIANIEKLPSKTETSAKVMELERRIQQQKDLLQRQTDSFNEFKQKSADFDAKIVRLRGVIGDCETCNREFTGVLDGNLLPTHKSLGEQKEQRGRGNKGKKGKKG